MRKNRYFFTDKNIYDALHHKRITIETLYSILHNRGIILSNELDKEELIREVCKLQHSYRDIEFIKEKIHSYDRRESTTLLVLDTNLDQVSLKNVIEKIKPSYSHVDETLSIVAQQNGNLNVSLDYQDFDLSKTELRQIENKSLDIEFEIKENQVRVRMPALEKSKVLISLIAKKIEEEKKEIIPKKQIRLDHIQDPKLRSLFFHRLVNHLESLVLKDVTNVELNRIQKSTDDEDDSEIEVGYVKKAILNGEAVSLSDIFTQLHNKGYYISKIVWVSEEQIKDGNNIIFEASFKEVENCTDFTYQIKGINNYNPQKGTHNITSRPPKENEKLKFYRIIENAAEQSLSFIEAKISNEKSEMVKN